MGCISCGEKTGDNVLLCKACFERLKDPFSLLPSLLDPTADMRLNHFCSVSMRIGPFSDSDITFGRGLEMITRLRELLMSSHKDQLPILIDRYLSMLGIDLRLYGDERLPRRGILRQIVNATSDLSFSGESWARALIRLGNIEALTAREMMKLPIEPSISIPYAKAMAENAVKRYERGELSPTLKKITEVNKAIILHFIGSSDDAIRRLDQFLSSEDFIDERHHILIWKATILLDLGRDSEAIKVIGELPKEFHERRVEKLRLLLGGLK